MNIAGQEISTDAEGYLTNLGDWSEDIAKYLAQADSLELTDNHWKLIHWMRNYYEENGTAPNLRVITKLAGNELGEDYSDKKYLFDLFPFGPAKQASRYAGMPKPTGCV